MNICGKILFACKEQVKGIIKCGIPQPVVCSLKTDHFA